jgi:protein SCO1/2
MNLVLGEDYRVITVSFNPKDDAEDARRTADRFRKKLLPSVGNKSGWIFLSGDQQNIVPLMKDLGFLYKEDKGEFAHTAAIFVLTPSGVISQHFTGISFPFRDVRLALVEASQGKVGTLLDQALLFCFRFDPSQGKYTWAAFNVVRAGAVITLLLIIGLFFSLRRREKISTKK